jgi:hypothetical protein
MKIRLLVALALIVAVALFWRQESAARPGTAGPATIDSLASPAGPGASEPNFAVASNGTVFMSWLEPADSAVALRVSSFDGRRWSAPSTVRRGRDFFVNWADFPSIEVLEGNRLAVHWLQRSGTGTYAYHVRLAQSTDGGATWSAPITPHTDTSATEHGFVALWREGASLGAAWLDGRKYNKRGRSPSNEMTVHATTIAADGRLGTERQLDGRACDCCQTSAAMTTRGPVVVYRDRSPDEIRDIYIVRRVNGTWTEGAPVYRDNWTINACPVNGPSVDARGDRVAVAWFTAANDSARVKLAVSTDAGATFGTPVRIDNGAPGGRVDVAALEDGSALVSWIERIGGDEAAVRVRRVSGSRAGDVVTIAKSSAARASGFPRMAISGDHAMFAWTVPGKPSSIRLARVPLTGFR